MTTMTVPLPPRFDFESALVFMSRTRSITIQPGQNLAFDFSGVQWVEPFGMLLIAARLRRLVRNCWQNGITCNVKGHLDDSQSHSYLAHMGFFQSIGVDRGKLPGEAPGNQRYVPITELTREDLIRDPVARFDTHLGETIERKSLGLARVLAQSESNLRETLKYAIREIIRNSFEHSGSDQVWIVGQCWPNSDKVEIAVLDEGIGILKSLSQNPNLKVDDDEAALTWAVKPGISGKTHQVTLRRTRSQESEWDNSGYGLYITNALCRLAGDFVLLSGKSALHTNPATRTFHPVHHSGTAVRICLALSRLPQLQQALKEIVDEGERLAAAEPGSPAIRSASKSSRATKTTDDDIPF